MIPPSPNAPESSPDVKLYRAASPINQVSSEDSPFLIMHGDMDTVVPYHQSENMEAALRKAGVLVKLIRVPGAGHFATSSGWDKIDWAGMTLDWFETHLPPLVSTPVVR
jgi:dipeptidyl aminopeptidase/acylaminoacyl peptidase